MAQESVLGGSGSVSTAPLDPPSGLEQIVATFGDIYEYIQGDGRLDAKWQADALTRIDLPFPLALAWDAARSVTQMTCHRKMAQIFQGVFEEILAQGLRDRIESFGGCFSFRPQRTGSKLSTHAWGIAIDLNSASNAQGSAGDMDAGVIGIFREAGFAWGGAWEGKRKDPMHFQFCTGY